MIVGSNTLACIDRRVYLLSFGCFFYYCICGTGGVLNNDDSIQQALAATGDKLVIPGLLVCAVASAAVVLIARRKISQN